MKGRGSMELGLSLGASHVYGLAGRSMVGHGALGEEDTVSEDGSGSSHGEEEAERAAAYACTPVQLELLPPGPVPRFAGVSSRSDNEVCSSRNLDVNRLAQGGEEAADNGGVVSPPKSTSSVTDGMGLSICTRLTTGRKRERHQTASNGLEITERPASRASDEEENGTGRKKLRLSKEQSAFLEESFKQHNTLNPKQKQALAKQLNLRPRQVEVWFQNRRARTKLKQTEVDCEYLKRCFDALTEENRRLQKELQEVRALKTATPSSQVPATTLTMCPSCERMSTTSKTGVLHAIRRSFAC